MTPGNKTVRLIGNMGRVSTLISLSIVESFLSLIPE